VVNAEVELIFGDRAAQGFHRIVAHDAAPLPPMLAFTTMGNRNPSAAVGATTDD